MFVEKFNHNRLFVYSMLPGCFANEKVQFYLPSIGSTFGEEFWKWLELVCCWVCIFFCNSGLSMTCCEIGSVTTGEGTYRSLSFSGWIVPGPGLIW